MTEDPDARSVTEAGLDMAVRILRLGLDEGMARGFPPLGPFLVSVNPDALRIVLDSLTGAPRGVTTPPDRCPACRTPWS